jgi:hypothetical protein
LTGIELRLAGGGNIIGVGQSIALELCGIFENGSEYVLDEAAASLSITSGNSVSLSGWTVTGTSEGESVITVEYNLDEATVLNAALTLGSTNQTYFTVTFDPNGGTRTGGGALTQSVISGGAAVAPTVARSGYDFAGWDKAFSSVMSDLTVTAQWTPTGGNNNNDDNGGGTDPTPKVTGKDTGTPAMPGQWANPFTDVKASDWFFDDVAYVYINGLMTGTSTNPMLFSPNMPLTRGMIVTILYRRAGSSDVSDLPNPFDDVPGDIWYADAVKWAVANGIVVGYGNGKYGANDNVTRQDLAVILHRYAYYAGISLPMAREYRSFLDDADIANYAKEAIEAFFRAAVINGYPDGGVHPKGEATRAEVAAMLHRFLNLAE